MGVSLEIVRIDKETFERYRKEDAAKPEGYHDIPLKDYEVRAESARYSECTDLVSFRANEFIPIIFLEAVTGKGYIDDRDMLLYYRITKEQALEIFKRAYAILKDEVENKGIADLNRIYAAPRVITEFSDAVFDSDFETHVLMFNYG